MARSWKLGLALAMASVMGFAAQSAFGAGFSVTGADWKPNRSILQIEGVAPRPDAVVLVRDAKTQALLGSAAVRADGKWMLKVRRPKIVPAKAVAELDGNCVQCVVAGAN